jgi:chromosome transmission fidelity protein 1
MQDIRDHILATPRDIEDLAQLGRELKTCPYYGSRRAIKQAEVRGISMMAQV